MRTSRVSSMKRWRVFPDVRQWWLVANLSGHVGRGNRGHEEGIQDRNTDDGERCFIFIFVMCTIIIAETIGNEIIGPRAPAKTQLEQ